jgi:hypothetical protein
VLVSYGFVHYFACRNEFFEMLMICVSGMYRTCTIVVCHCCRRSSVVYCCVVGVYCLVASLSRYDT